MQNQNKREITFVIWSKENHSIKNIFCYVFPSFMPQ